jgi:hypothetical protein
MITEFERKKNRNQKIMNLPDECCCVSPDKQRKRRYSNSMKQFALYAGLLFLLVSCTSTKPAQIQEGIADIDPITLDPVSIGFDKIFSADIQNNMADVVFQPRDNTVYLEFKYEMVKYRQHWNRDARERFIAAVEQYNDDFENRRLIDKKSKTTSVYGKFNGKTEWGTFVINSRGTPQVTMGYIFKKENPYFLITQQPAKNERMPGDSGNSSLRITIYLTKAQTAVIANLFRQEYLTGLVPESALYGTQNGIDEGAPSAVVEPDIY